MKRSVSAEISATAATFTDNCLEINRFKQTAALEYFMLCPIGADSPREPYSVPHPAGSATAGASVSVHCQDHLQHKGSQSGSSWINTKPLPPAESHFSSRHRQQHEN